LYTVKLGIGSPVCLMTKLGDTAWRWHARYGHLNFRALRDLGLKQMVEGMPVVDRVEQVCDGCTLGKQHRTPFPKVSSFRANEVLELFHADLCGHVRPKTIGGKSYFLLVVDDFNRYMWIELLKSKDEALFYLKKIKQRAKVEQEGRLKALRTDRGDEFNSTLFDVFCSEQGIKHYTTTPYSPQQNGVVERRNQSVVEMTRCVLKSKGVPLRFWGEAVTTVVYLLNRSPTKSIKGKTPYEVWHGRKPQVGHLRTFGCVCHVKKIGTGLGKMSDRSSKMVLLGYKTGTKGYRFFDPSTERLHVSRDVLFEEDKSWNRDSENSTEQIPSVPETCEIQF
jgi:transposase InsO family protein